MSKNTLTSLSKFLSLVLRHQPQLIGLRLDEAGWVGIDTLMEQANAAGHALTRELLQAIVTTNDKQRFAISADGLRIRANQGHSVEVELGLAPQVPPARLFHGTASRFLDSILSSGLNKGARHHVHLSAELGVAGAVGRRYGRSGGRRGHHRSHHRAVGRRHLGAWRHSRPLAEAPVPGPRDRRPGGGTLARTSAAIRFAAMGQYGDFQLEGVATRIRFAEEIERSTSMREVADGFQRYRILNSRHLPKTIPLA